MYCTLSDRHAGLPPVLAKRAPAASSANPPPPPPPPAPPALAHQARFRLFDRTPAVSPMAGPGQQGRDAFLRRPLVRAVRLTKRFPAHARGQQRAAVLAPTALSGPLPTVGICLLPSWLLASSVAAAVAPWESLQGTASLAGESRGALARWNPRRALERYKCCSWRSRPYAVSPLAGNATRLFSRTREVSAGTRLRRESLMATLTPVLRVCRSPDSGAAAQPKHPHDEKAEKDTMASRAARHEKEVKEADAIMAAANGSADPAIVVKKDVWARVKEGAKHYWDGSRLLAYEVKISTKLLYRLAKGDTLTRREHRQLKRTTADMLRLVPFLVFVIVPFLEFLLPVVLKLFPNMLPSTFEDKDLAEAKKKKLLKVRLDVAEFLQDTIGEIGIQGSSSNAKAAKEFADFFRNIRTTGNLASAENISKMAKRFEDDITLENLSRPQLVSMCRYMNINAFGTDNFLRFQIRNKMLKLKTDDKVSLFLLVTEEYFSLSAEAETRRTFPKRRSLAAGPP
ncbi:MAG: LETM1-like protein-domain-containing protein [Olpidium bornovanus]|uniref:LETM1-like protein-domain-containing protein n=1 Tax=Olpidium bornovanus TaxID=278681 RepID=A0A8H8DEH4_9FUNG|nr:MAG: LETM1-like protein-domain-containing protein [Olpidium bornovanus]